MAIMLWIEPPAMSDETDRPRTESGQYETEVTPEQALAVFTDHEPRTASEVGEELGIVRRTAYNKLQTLANEGNLRKKKVGSHAVVYWKPD